MDRLEREVDQLFSDIGGRHDELCINPVTGGCFVFSEGQFALEKEMARRALLARKWFAKHGPQDAPWLPLSSGEIEDLKYKGQGLDHIVSRFAYSLRSVGWDFNSHPSFEDFARGVLASKTAPRFILEDWVLRRGYPPRPLAGLSPYLVWERPEQHARTMEAYRRTQARYAATAAASV
jgi:hypothetical protein